MAKTKRRGVRYRLTEGESTPVKAEEDGADTGLLLAEGLDAAFVGVGRRCGQPEVAVYALEKAVEILVRGGAANWAGVTIGTTRLTSLPQGTGVCGFNGLVRIDI